MIIEIRYPKIQSGQLITIHTGLFRPVKSIIVEGSDVQKIDDNHYQFTSTISDKTKVIEILPNTLDYPSIKIDNKEYYYFDPIPFYEKVIMVSPIVLNFLFGRFIGIAFGIITLFFMMKAMLQQASRVTRYAVALVIIIISALLSYYGNQVVTDIIGALS